MAKRTQLYDYKAKEPVLLGGTHSQFSTDEGVTWLPLKGAQELGDIGDIAESVECTTIDDDRKVYCGGLKDSAEKRNSPSTTTMMTPTSRLSLLPLRHSRRFASVISGLTAPELPMI